MLGHSAIRCSCRVRSVLGWFGLDSKISIAKIACCAVPRDRLGPTLGPPEHQSTNRHAKLVAGTVHDVGHPCFEMRCDAGHDVRYSLI